MRNDVELALVILEEIVVARASPISVTVNQRHIQGQEPEQAVDVEDRRECLLQLIGRCLIERVAERNQVFPGLLIILRLDLESSPIFRDILAQVPETTIRARVAAHFPPSPFGRAIVFGQELLVELLNVGIQAPAFPIDDDLDKVCLGCRDVLPGNMRVQQRTHHRRIAAAVEEIERLISVKTLVWMHEIKRQIERSLVSGGDHHVRRHAAEVNSHVRIDLAIDGQPGGDLDIRPLKVGQFRFPILVFEIEKQSAQHGRVIEWCVRIRFDVRGRDTWTGCGGLTIATATGPSWRAEATTAWSTAAASVAQGGACGCPLIGIQYRVTILVEVLDHLPLLTHRSTGPTGRPGPPGPPGPPPKKGGIRGIISSVVSWPSELLSSCFSAAGASSISSPVISPSPFLSMASRTGGAGGPKRGPGSRLGNSPDGLTSGRSTGDPA